MALEEEAELNRIAKEAAAEVKRKKQEAEAESEAE